MDEKDLFERLDQEFEEFSQDREESSSVVPYDSVAAYRLASEIQDILRLVVPSIVVEKHE